ncbi:MAG: hypothetical protein KAI90_03500 [Desulfobulbaceae bacterium]|nr:hypothetical protein [Desulfobulbaceae bacterium]MCK5543869.1 hypothetical protein [Desulfobulbaceae bacterium]
MMDTAVANHKNNMGAGSVWRRVLPVLLGVLIVLAVSVGLAAAARKKPVKVTQKEINMAVSLQEREAAVTAKEKELEKKEAEFNVIKKEVDEKLDRLTALQEEVQAKLDEYRVVQEKPFKDLVKIYSTMSASKVAPLLNQMEDATVARILGAMKTETVSKIIPKLPPDKAVKVSKALGRIK